MTLDIRDDGPAFPLEKVEDPVDPTDVDGPATADPDVRDAEYIPVVIPLPNSEIVSPSALVKGSVMIGGGQNAAVDRLAGGFNLSICWTKPDTERDKPCMASMDPALRVSITANLSSIPVMCCFMTT
jgi:hypothetical protein